MDEKKCKEMFDEWYSKLDRCKACNSHSEAIAWYAWRACWKALNNTADMPVS